MEEAQTKAERVKEQNRIRSKKMYDKKKEEINLRRRETYNAKKSEHEAAAISAIKVVVAKAVSKTKNDILLDKVKELELNPGTKTKYVADLNRLLSVIENEDILTNMKKGKELVAKIESTNYASNTKRGIIQLCLFMITNFKLTVNKKSVKAMTEYFNTLKVRASDETAEKQNTEVVPSWVCYLDKVQTAYGEQSKMYMISRLYKEITLRDDFILKIVNKKPKSGDENYIILNKSNMRLIINNYKTEKKYGVIDIKLTKGLSALLRGYMERNNLTVGDYLFGDQKLSDFVRYNNSKIGFNGGTNMYRHMTITEELLKIKNVEERVKLADKMKHNVFTQAEYLRKME